jgi:Protein of unknown function (DUF664)
VVSPPINTDLQPTDEATALLQRLDQYRAIAAAALADVSWQHASTRLLPATDMTIGGIVKHLAWAEDRWFQGRLRGSDMPARRPVSEAAKPLLDTTRSIAQRQSRRSASAR